MDIVGRDRQLTLALFTCAAKYLIPKGMKHFVCVAACLAVQLLFAPFTRAGTATNNTIPYKDMDEFCGVAAGVDQSKLLVRTFVSSTNKAVKSADITLTIQSSKGAVPIQIGTNGQILNFPHQKELLRENPSVVVNQPKGSLNLVITIEIPLPDALVFHYAVLADAAAEINKLIKAKAGMMSLLAPKAKGAIFIFPRESAGKAKVTITSATGQKEFIADKEGQVKLKLEKTLIAENPEVHLSEKPRVVGPDIE